MLMLASPTRSRIFGMGTLTLGPAPAGGHRGVVDLAVHANHAAHRDDLLGRLLAEAVSRRISILEARVAVADTGKLDALSRAGFRPVATLRGHLKLRDGEADVLQLEARL